MQKKWTVAPSAPDDFRAEHPELPNLVLQLLWNRNLRTQHDIDEFLNPDYHQDIHDPFLFRHMQRAVDRLFRAIEKQEKIVVHGDYDADGVSASVILTTTLRILGATVDIFLPHRETDGYGLNMRTVDKLAAEGTNVIITCDCGISNVQEIAHAADLGIDVIITDHHQEPVILPERAYAMIHPKIIGETYPWKGLAGGGVAFKLAQGLLKTHATNNATLPNGEKHEAFEKWQLDMVAISSVADMVPLLGETRTLVRYGLMVLEKTRRTGLRRLMKGAGIINHDGTPRRSMITASDIGFKIAPRINAAGRMHHASAAFHLLMEDDDERAKELALALNDNNTARQEITAELVEAARTYIRETAQENDAVIIVTGDNFSAGLVGLIASKIKDEFYKPTIVLARQGESYVGSGRSTLEFNMIEGLQKIPHCFEKFGGHPQACGFTLKHGLPVDTLKQELSCIVRETIPANIIPTLPIDAEVQLEEITWDLYDILEKFEPFGVGNPEPRYVARGCEVVSVEPVGANGKHTRLHLRHSTSIIRKIIGFNCATLCEALKTGDRIDLVFEVGVNEWNGNRELQIKLVDLIKMTARDEMVTEPYRQEPAGALLALPL